MMDPIRDAWTDCLSEYVDGELDAAERAALDVHLQLCEGCTGVVEELRAVLLRAGALEASAPETDLWPAIEARIAVGGTPAPLTTPPLPALALVTNGYVPWSMSRNVPWAPSNRIRLPWACA